MKINKPYPFYHPVLLSTINQLKEHIGDCAIDRAPILPAAWFYIDNDEPLFLLDRSTPNHNQIIYSKILIDCIHKINPQISNEDCTTVIKQITLDMFNITFIDHIINPNEL